jgi:integration host factor subunit beta
MSPLEGAAQTVFARLVRRAVLKQRGKAPSPLPKSSTDAGSGTATGVRVNRSNSCPIVGALAPAVLKRIDSASPKLDADADDQVQNSSAGGGLSDNKSAIAVASVRVKICGWRGYQMTKSELAARLLARRAIRSQDAEKIVAAVLDTIAASLASGGRVELRGFGSFSVRQTPSRIGRNPRTGDQVAIREKRHVHFRAGKNMRGRLGAP